MSLLKARLSAAILSIMLLYRYYQCSFEFLLEAMPETPCILVVQAELCVLRKPVR